MNDKMLQSLIRFLWAVVLASVAGFVVGVSILGIFPLDFTVGVAIGQILVMSLAHGIAHMLDDKDTQKCPDCRADIPADASVCMHCQCKIEQAVSLVKDLHDSAAGNNVERIKRLIAKGANVNAKDSRGAIALHWASANNAIDATKVLLDNGANINIKDNYGQTAWDVAKKEQHECIAQILRSRGGK